MKKIILTTIFALTASSGYCMMTHEDAVHDYLMQGDIVKNVIDKGFRHIEAEAFKNYPNNPTMRAFLISNFVNDYMKRRSK